MTDKKKQPKTGATELGDDDLNAAQGGWSWGETNSSILENGAGKLTGEDIGALKQK